jgi:hypothetical protein
MLSDFIRKRRARSVTERMFHRVHNQIQKNLLQLTSIGKQLRESLAQFS